MTESLSQLVRTSDPKQPNIPHHKISGQEPPVRIFKNNFMEALTLISLRTFLTTCFSFEVISMICAETHTTSLWQQIGYTFLGIPSWIITEYLIHRFLFHFVSNNQHIQHLIYVFHGNHHIQPSHPKRTLMPLIVTIPLGSLIWALCVWIAGLGKGSSFFSGFFLGYVLYDYIHFATHNFSMKQFPFSIWKRHHLLHHYRTEEHNYSITMPWLDTLLRTKYHPKHK